MNVYALPLERPAYARDMEISQTSRQKHMYLKYTTVIRAFLAGYAAEVLRMRLKQAADTKLMSVKTFLYSNQTDIVLALRDRRSFLLLVFPPFEKAPDLTKWSTRLLCIVLRASNCLNLREQDDVILLARTYRRYFENRLQIEGSYVMVKQGSAAKREWFKVCAAVQRMLEIVDDVRLMREVRNFVCKVNMETMASSGSRKTPRLKLIQKIMNETLIAKDRVKLTVENLPAMEKEKNRRRNIRVIKDKPVIRNSAKLGNIPAERSLSEIKFSDEASQKCSDEASQNIKRERLRSAPVKRKTHVQRPHTADACIIRNQVDTSLRKVSITNKRPATATHRDVVHGTKYKKDHSFKKKSPNAIYIPWNTTEESPDVKRESVRKKTRKRPSTAARRTSTMIPTERSQSARTYRRNSVNSKASTRSVRSFTSLSGRRRITTNKAFGNSGKQSMKGNGNHENNENTETTAVSRPSSRKNARTKSAHVLGNTSNNSISELDRSIEKTNVNKRENEESKDNKLVQSSERKNASLNTENMPTSKAKNKTSGGKQKNETDSRRRHRETLPAIKGPFTERKDNPTYVSDIIRKALGKDKDKRKEFDENMKKIVNDVIVHQQVSAAAKNPLLQDRAFVDALFSFLNENQVTKKFLRTRSTDPKQVWKLPNGTHVNFTFFLAFIFQHVRDKEMDMVCYVVEKMLLRMKCEHTKAEEKEPEESVAVEKSKVEPSRVPGTGNTKLSYTQNRLVRGESPAFARDNRPLSKSSDSSKRSKSEYLVSEPIKSKDETTDPTTTKNTQSETNGSPTSVSRCTTITDGQCWKCLQKDTALTASVNWRNRRLCDQLISNGVAYREEHLSAAIKANDMVTLVKIVEFLKQNGYWNPDSKASKDALYLAKKLGMQQMVKYLIEEGVKDERVVNHTSCTSCYIT